MKWNPFKHQGKLYDLSHLHPVSMRYEQPAKDGKPARVYKVDVQFLLHCFTRGARKGEQPDHALLYSDNRETRIFDFQRYELSTRLPKIVECLAQRKCYHTGKGNFFSIEVIDEDGTIIEYDVFFTASRSSNKGVINLYVQSAYVRDEEHGTNRPDKKPIGFYVILHNTLSGKAIKPGPK